MPRDPESDPATTDALVRAALAEATGAREDDDAYWRSVHLLQRGDVGEVWTHIEPLGSHDDPRVRSLVPDVLRFLGGASRPLTEDSIALFRRMLGKERSRQDRAESHRSAN
jgi:hypothetical protein